MSLETSECSLSTSFQDLPPHLQHLIFASAAAPLTTCKASAAVAQEASLVATWLLARNQQPLKRAAKHQLWDVCGHLFSTYHYIPSYGEFRGVLKCSASKGATAVVATLLQWCCKEHHEHCDMCAALQIALQVDGHVAVCNLLAQHPTITAQTVRTAVVTAAGRGQAKSLQLLITSRPDAASPHLHGSPMFAAAANGHVESMQILLQHGADINCKPGTPWSEMGEARKSQPVQYAVMNGRDRATQWMLEQGADAGPALAAAAEYGNLFAARLLLSKGADTMLVWGGLALRSALRRGHDEMVHLLLSAGPPDGFMSKARPHPDIVVDSLDFCVCRFLGKHDCHTASALLQAAVQHGHTVFAQMLQEQGVA
jgi:hypothetical protein